MIVEAKLYNSVNGYAFADFGYVITCHDSKW